MKIVSFIVSDDEAADIEQRSKENKPIRLMCGTLYENEHFDIGVLLDSVEEV